ncbi:hypothetical protein KUV57_11230 [Epibacterium sp. DP7N7-1]|nr:hypothetical protein [Epibacterium sp. DP7N7-1]
MPTQIPGTPVSLAIAKSQARRLSAALEGRFPLKHGQALELVARLHGQESWGHLRSLIEGGSATVSSDPIPGPTEDLGCLIEHTTLNEVFSLVIGPRPHEFGPAEIAVRATLSELKHVFPEALGSGESMYLKRITHSDIRAAEKHAREKGQVRVSGTKTSDFIAQRLSCSTRWTAQGVEPEGAPTLSSIEAGFSSLTPYETSEVPRNQLFPGAHAVMIGGSPSAFMSRHPEAIDLTGPYPADLNRLAREWALPCPVFLSGFTGLSWLVSRKIEAIVQSAPETPYAHSERKTVVLAISDMLRNSGAEVLLAQARSMGLHLVVWVDDPNVDPEEVKILTRHTPSLIDLRNAPAVMIRNRTLHETLGGKLKVAGPVPAAQPARKGGHRDSAPLGLK